MNHQYKVFMSDAGDWYVAAHFDGGVNVLYEGHDREGAYKSILEHQGFNIPIIEKVMDGAYEPTPNDWNESV